MADLCYNAEDLQRCEQYAAESKRAAREVDEKSIIQMASAYTAAVNCRKGHLNSALREMRRVVKELESQPDRSLEIRAKSLLGEALVACGTDEGQKEGKELLAEMLQLAEQLSLKLEIKRLDRSAGAN